MNLQTFELENLINALPQNRPLYKESGSWSVRTEDLQNEYMSQRHNETFKQFIIRYLEWVMEYEKDYEEQLLWNLTMPIGKDIDKYEGYHKCPKCGQRNGLINDHYNHIDICDA